ncbi:MAG: PriCT-2 domain-containing protein [Alistipes sp.]|nr:PriCT-2 domain-containing protein [Alistipes sp.]
MGLITEITPLNKIIKGVDNPEWVNVSSNSLVRIPDNIHHPRVSLFRNYYATQPVCTVSLWEFLTFPGFKNDVVKCRKSKEGKKRDYIKSNLPCITVSGVFDTRDKTKRLQHIHSGYLCIDIDGKDNKHIYGAEWFPVKKRLMKLFNSLAYAGISINGNGLCLIFRIEYPEKHIQHFNALVAEIKERIGLIADESCKGVARLRGASFDAYPCFNFCAKPYFKVKDNIYPDNSRVPLDRTAREQDLIDTKVNRLIEKIRKGKIDITANYKDWYKIGCAFAAEYGKEEGNRKFHLVSMWHPKYYPSECDEQFAKCLQYGSKTTILSFFKICKEHGVTFK